MSEDIEIAPITLDFTPIKGIQFVLGVRKFEIKEVWRGKDRVTVHFFELAYPHKEIIRSAASLAAANIHYAGINNKKFPSL